MYKNIQFKIILIAFISSILIFCGLSAVYFNSLDQIKNYITTDKILNVEGALNLVSKFEGQAILINAMALNWNNNYTYINFSF